MEEVPREVLWQQVVTAMQILQFTIAENALITENAAIAKNATATAENAVSTAANAANWANDDHAPD